MKNNMLVWGKYNHNDMFHFSIDAYIGNYRDLNKAKTLCGINLSSTNEYLFPDGTTKDRFCAYENTKITCKNCIKVLIGDT